MITTVQARHCTWETSLMRKRKNIMRWNVNSPPPPLPKKCGQIVAHTVVLHLLESYPFNEEGVQAREHALWWAVISLVRLLLLSRRGKQG